MTLSGLIHDVIMDELAHTTHTLTSSECHDIASAIARALRDEYSMRSWHGEWYTAIPINEFPAPPGAPAAA